MENYKVRMQNKISSILTDLRDQLSKESNEEIKLRFEILILSFEKMYQLLTREPFDEIEALDKEIQDLTVELQAQDLCGTPFNDTTSLDEWLPDETMDDLPF